MKAKIIKIIAVICYYSGLVKLFYRLNRHSKRIVTFHNVIPANLLPKGKKIGLVDTEDEFENKIIELSRYFSFSNDLRDAKSITITFDDGYKNQFEIAGRILEHLGNINATVFVSGAVLNCNSENALTVDLLMHWIELAPEGEYYILCNSNIKYKFNLTDQNRQEIWQSIIWPNFSLDTKNKGRSILDTLDSQYPISKILGNCDQRYLRLRLSGVSSKECENYLNTGWTIGWHTINHFPLSRLSDEEKSKEICDSPAFMKPVVFSYPYGELASVDKTTIDVVKEAGYPCAVSNLPDPGNSIGVFFMPRYTLDYDKFLLHFELSGIKYFLTNFRRLPVVKL